MRIKRMAVYAVGLPVMLAAFGIAGAGEFTSSGEGGGSYQFTDCAKPEKPVLTIDRALKGRKAISARNANVRDYNKYVATANAYMACLTAEADRDIQIHFRAVSGLLEFEQREMMVGLEDLLVEISTAKAGLSSGQTGEILDKELLGGPEQVKE